MWCEFSDFSILPIFPTSVQFMLTVRQFSLSLSLVLFLLLVFVVVLLRTKSRCETFAVVSLGGDSSWSR